MKSIYSSLLLLSIAEVVTAGPLPARPVVDVRLDHNPTVDELHLPSTGQVWQIASDSSVSYDDDFGNTYKSNKNLDLIYEDLTLLPSSGVAIQPRGAAATAAKDAAGKGAKGGAKQSSSSSVNTPGGGLNTAGKVTGDVAKVTGELGAAVEGVPIVGEVLGTALEVVTSFLNILSKVFSAVAQMEKKSAEERGKFTQETVEAFMKAHPGWNVVVAYAKDSHAFYGQGAEGKDWSHQNTATHTVLGKYNYDVYGTHAGIFVLQGDGGFENWAYMKTSQVKAVGKQNHRLIFSGPAPSGVPKGDVGIHLIQYNKNDDGSNANFDLVAIISVGGMVVGFSGEGNLGGPISIPSQLHDAITISATNKNNKDAALDILYKGKHTLTSACKMGDYKNGKYRQGDCTLKG